MSHHEVSCDSCLKGNFRGKRYKCLVCFDYDLCATCFDAGVTSTRHTTEHPMQCILTRTDFDLFYGGEAVSPDTPQSFTCPFCGKLGFTEVTLQEHVTSEHSDSSTEVVCPICASLPGGEPNHVTEDFATHLNLEHRNSRELEEPQTAIRGRRAPHPSRGISGTRTRRSQFSSSSGLSSLSPGSRDSMDPIAELLSQLSGVRRAANLSQSHSSQLQQLQMQLQLERHGGAQIRQSIERAPIERVIRRHQQAGQGQQQMSSNSQSTVNGTHSNSLPYVLLMEPSPSPSTLSAAAAAAGMSQTNPTSASSATSSQSSDSQFMLNRCNEPSLSENELQALEILKADRSTFVQELLLTTMTDYLNIDEVKREDGTPRSLTHDASYNETMNDANVHGIDGVFEEDGIEDDEFLNCDDNRPHSMVNDEANSNNSQCARNACPTRQQSLPLDNLPQLRQLRSCQSNDNDSDSNLNLNVRPQEEPTGRTLSSSSAVRRKVLRSGASHEASQPQPN